MLGTLADHPMNSANDPFESLLESLPPAQPSAALPERIWQQYQSRAPQEADVSGWVWFGGLAVAAAALVGVLILNHAAAPTATPLPVVVAPPTPKVVFNETSAKQQAREYLLQQLDAALVQYRAQAETMTSKSDKSELAENIEELGQFTAAIRNSQGVKIGARRDGDDFIVSFRGAEASTELRVSPGGAVVILNNQAPEKEND